MTVTPAALTRPQSGEGSAPYVPPGEYRLNLVLKDATSGNMNNYELPLHVPRF